MERLPTTCTTMAVAWLAVRLARESSLELRHGSLKKQPMNSRLELFLLHCRTVSPFVAWEICCRPQSTLSEACAKLGVSAFRKTLEDGYDIEKDQTKIRLLEEQRIQKPG